MLCSHLTLREVLKDIRHAFVSVLEGDLIGSLKRQDLTCIGWCCEFHSQSFDDLAGTMHLTALLIANSEAHKLVL